VPDLKTCPGCRVTLPRRAFHRNARHKDGLQTYCRGCQLAYQAGYLHLRPREPEDPAIRGAAEGLRLPGGLNR
jgi:hypothetical protein